jgi:hypothetical protein
LTGCGIWTHNESEFAVKNLWHIIGKASVMEEANTPQGICYTPVLEQLEDKGFAPTEEPFKN